MKEITLSNYDYKYIANLAHKLFIQEDIRVVEKYDNFLAYCFFQATVSYCTKNNWTIVDGKVVENNEKT